jgi:iron-sulfur cluster repair protein YtfE (RIC family)
MSTLPYVGATPEQLRSPLVREFLSVHDMFRNQLQGIVEYIEDLLSGEAQLDAPETRVRIQALIRAGSQYTQMLHSHHHAETSIMFPALQKDGLDQVVVDKLNADHDEISVLIDQFDNGIHHLAGVDSAVMNHDLRRLSDALRDHLAYEETHVCPLMARWSQWPGMH